MLPGGGPNRRVSWHGRQVSTPSRHRSEEEPALLRTADHVKSISSPQGGEQVQRRTYNPLNIIRDRHRGARGARTTSSARDASLPSAVCEQAIHPHPTSGVPYCS
jgi:hypothetical protein